MFGQSILIAICGIIGLGVVALIAHVARGSGLDRMLGEFWQSRSDVPFSDQQTELKLRAAASRFRHLATEATLRDPARYAEHIKRLARHEAMKIAHTDKALARDFIAWADSAHLEEILYRKAVRLVLRRTGRTYRPKHDHHLHGALTVRK